MALLKAYMYFCYKHVQYKTTASPSLSVELYELFQHYRGLAVYLLCFAVSDI